MPEAAEEHSSEREAGQAVWSGGLKVRGRVRVLLVDDSAVVRERLCALLAEVDGVEVAGEAADVAEAEAAAARLEPDAVVLDMQLATGNGLAVLRQLRRSGRRALVIVLTNHLHPQYRRACMAGGADYFLDKSTEFPAVAEILGQAAAL